MRFIKILLFTTAFCSFEFLMAQADNCSFATSISVTTNCSSPTSGTTIGATQNIPGCVGNADDDVWYQFVATNTAHQIIVTPSASMDPVVQLFSNVCSSLTSMSCMDQGFTGQTETINASGLTIGNTYRIRVYHYGTGSGSGTFTICVTNPPPAPANDLCPSPTNLLVNTTCVNTAATTVGATQSFAGCTGNADDDVWFTFTAVNSTATITVNPSSSMDPVVELLSGGSCGSLNSIQCEDSQFLNGNEVINAVGLIPGNIYYIRVYDYYGGNGYPFDICITGPAASSTPTNDEPCNAIALPAVTSDCNFLQFTTVGATASMGAPTPSACAGGSAPQQGGFGAGSADVWFSFTAPANGQVSITPQPNFGINDGVMALYSGTCGSLTQIACSDDYNYPGTGNDFKPLISETGLTPGATYYIRYWGYGTNAGDFGICVSSPVNDYCATALYICDLNGYSGTTSAAYTADRPCNMRGNAELNDPPTYTFTPGTNTGGIFGQAGSWGTGSPLFDVQINNNSWIKFTAGNTTAVLNVAISNCWVGNYPSGGIQMQIFEATNCCNFTPVSNFEESSTSFTITANNLTIGNDYYLMIDGYAGDICSYTITANSGIQFPDIIVPRPTICFGDTTTLFGPALASSYLWMPGGDTTQNITVQPSTTTTYTLVVEGVCGNKQTMTKTITVNPNPTIQINNGNPVSVCNGSTATLTASGGNTYVWDDNSTNNPRNVNPSTPTTYWVEGTDANGCVGYDTTTVQILTQPTANITANDTSICVGDSLVLHASGGGTYTWSDNSTLDSLIVSPTTTTTYWVAVDVGGCTDTASFVVTVHALPTPSISGNNTICVGDSTTLTASGGSTYLWNTTATSAAITVTPTTTTTYSVMVTNANGCSDSTSVTITVNPLPNITITGNDSICLGSTATLTATGAASYVWSNGATTPSTTVSPTNSTTYTVVGTSSFGCIDSAQHTVYMLPQPVVSISGTNVICDGEATQLTATGGGNYLWSNNDTASTITVMPNDTTIYTVVVTTNGCVDSASYTVIVKPLPLINAYTDTTIMLGQSAPIYAQGTPPFVWTPADSLSCTTCPNPTATPRTTTTYCVETQKDGCFNTACVTIYVDETCGEVFVPNAFSPNGDGNNDCLKVYSNCLSEVLFRVYSRWGALIYESEDIDGCWDGFYNGTYLNSGVYVYTVQAKLINGEEIELKGDVTIFK